MAEIFQMTAADGHQFDGYRSDPTGTAKGGIIVLHAIYGLTTHIGNVCDLWAAEGYSAIAPALFDRIGKKLVHDYDADGTKAGQQNYVSLTKEGILADIDAASGILRETGPVIISGFCTGGSWAWTAASTQGFAAQVNFYGSHIADRLDSGPQCPTILHYGDADHVVSNQDIVGIRAAYPGVEVHLYPDTGHAFFNPEQKNYHPESAELALRRSTDFLERILGSSN
jgi:carboxymethylenebutenolidase